MVSFNNFKVFPKCFCTLFQTGLLFRVQLYLSQVCNTILPRIQRTIRNTSSFITYKPLIMVETGCTLQRLFKMFCVKLATDRPMAQEVLLFILIISQALAITSLRMFSNCSGSLSVPISEVRVFKGTPAMFTPHRNT